MDHGQRAHAQWSASASERNFACPGALALIEHLGLEDRETRAAAWGTACHQVAERCLRSGVDADAHLGARESTKGFSFIFDEEMAECTQVFLDYVRGRLSEYDRWCRANGVDPDAPENRAQLLIEQKFDLAPIEPPFEAGGTGDAVLLFPAWGLIEIVDLKTGGMWVEATGNKQLRTYALGAAIANPGPWKRVKSTIVQPRVGDTPVRSEEIDICDLLDWTSDLVEAMQRSRAAYDTFPEGGLVEGDAASEAWIAAHLNPGDHCRGTFCAAAARCPALQVKVLQEAHTFFSPVEAGVEAVAPPPDPRSLPVPKIVGILDAADMIEAWLNAVRQYARELVEAGQEVGPYILVDKRAMRKWKDEDTLAADLKRLVHLEGEALYERKLKSPAQIDKLVGKQGAKLIADLWAQESSGTNLVRSDKTTREKALPPAQKFFESIKEN
ncbi:DUF2800 domain-containing protein [Thauera sp.]|uniref:DUF2800 domain-containing protein n=1 Tax=Thauera sp. TaxID=1905334 RepID=UPI002C1E15B9|nr:DUF2800 domain-containing protein [Thauera sp.]HRP25382.1 DUF2800 domain-containing protein [Thauera sp.]